MVIKIILMLVALLPIFYFANSYISFADSSEDDENWHNYYLLGRFFDTDSSKFNKIFLFQYRTVNGTVDLFTHDDIPGFIAETHSDRKGLFEIKFPRNYPYTNNPNPTSNNHNFIVLINKTETDSFTMKKDECHFVFSIPYSGQTQIKLYWTYLLSQSEVYKRHGDEIPKQCINETIVDGLPPSQQFKAGVEAQNIQCKESLQLVIKSIDGSPACVKPETKTELIKRGWAKSIEF